MGTIDLSLSTAETCSTKVETTSTNDIKLSGRTVSFGPPECCSPIPSQVVVSAGAADAEASSDSASAAEGEDMFDTDSAETKDKWKEALEEKRRREVPADQLRYQAMAYAVARSTILKEPAKAEIGEESASESCVDRDRMPRSMPAAAAPTPLSQVQTGVALTDDQRRGIVLELRRMSESDRKSWVLDYFSNCAALVTDDAEFFRAVDGENCKELVPFLLIQIQPHPEFYIQALSYLTRGALFSRVDSSLLRALAEVSRKHHSTLVRRDNHTQRLLRYVASNFVE